MMNLKELRARQKSVQSIKKLTGALKMVSRSKLGKAQAQWRQAKDSFDNINVLMSKLVALYRWHQKDLPVPSNAQAPKVLIVLSSDRGFCGNFNNRLLQALRTYLQQTFYDIQVITIGHKILPALKKDLSISVMESIHSFKDFSYSHAGHLLEKLYLSYIQGHIRGCSVLSMRYHNSLTQEPEICSLLPFDTSSLKEEHASLAQWFSGTVPVFEIENDQFFHETLRLFFFSELTSLAKEHLVSEHNARMMAMDNASENADNMLGELEKQYNYLRQSSITKELVEIISGAQALEG